MRGLAHKLPKQIEKASIAILRSQSLPPCQWHQAWGWVWFQHSDIRKVCPPRGCGRHALHVGFCIASQIPGWSHLKNSSSSAPKMLFSTVTGSVLHAFVGIQSPQVGTRRCAWSLAVLFQELLPHLIGPGPGPGQGQSQNRASAESAGYPSLHFHWDKLETLFCCCDDLHIKIP